MAARVEGKVAIITGGASGIGRSCAHRLAEEGATVIITDIQENLGLSVVDEITQQGGKAEFIVHDVTKESDWEDVVSSVKGQHQKLDILVNNAGVGIGGSIVEMTLDDWQLQQAINLDGVFLGTKHCIPLMRDTGGGSIINMSSVAGLQGSPNLAAYNATKGGVRLFTKGVAKECAINRWAIRVNSVHPGIIDTPIWTKINIPLGTEGDNTFDIDAMAAVVVPTGELGTPRDIANGVLFLASDDSTYITGTELVIDGGLSA
ncbi:MAG: NAD(P)-dependent dehydrogenase (short-subunit alcohol dehydrogenase family) [Candidatus Azotimanducaceae bacterium]|jgi:NAD(P)-dependent dehydrogenase (short-subunit alcohol dehydrogenase family)